MISSLAELTRAMDAAWMDLDGFLSGLTESRRPKVDHEGWTIVDHLTHLWVWEDSVAILFRGEPRHVALGVSEEFYTEASFEAINDHIRERTQGQTFQEAVGQLRAVHRALMASVSDLSDAQLQSEVRDLFPEAPRTDDRRVLDFIYENTADHFIEHLGWMKDMLKGRSGDNG